MAKTFTAKIGDSLCNIAYLNGFGDCKPLREEPANAFIVNRTTDPAQVLPGDVVTIPDFIEHDESGATDATHNFVKRGDRAILRFVHGSATAKVENDRTLTFLNVSNYITNKAGTEDGTKSFPNASVRKFNKHADKDPDTFKIEVLDINETGDLDVELEVLKPDYNAAGAVTGHSRFPAAIRADRLLPAKASVQGKTKRFRTCYLRLVVDDEDKKAAPDQTLLTSDMFDPADAATKQIEILDQTVKATYTIPSCPMNPKCKSTVTLPIGEDRMRLRLAIHVLNNIPAKKGGTPVVPLADAERRVFTWFRRVYAQANIAPKLMQPTRAVDPPGNLIAISNDNGLSAKGDGKIGFTIKVEGKPDVVIGPISPKAGDKPIDTAKALAALVTAPFTAVPSENPARLNDKADLKSADIVITENSKERVTLSIDVPKADRDTGQTIEIGAADPLNLLSWAVTTKPKEINNNWNVGSIEQRAVLKNHDTGDNRVDIFVAVQLSEGNRGEAMMSHHLIDPDRASIEQVKWSAFLARRTMDASDKNPFSFPHEVGHVTGEVVHAIVTKTDKRQAAQLMRSGTNEDHPVDGSKRIRDGVVSYGTPRGSFNLIERLRKEGEPLLEPW